MPSKHRRIPSFVIALLATAAFFAAAPALAQCPGGLYYADMDRPQQANFMPAFITNVEYGSNPNPDCPDTRALKLDIEIPETCSAAVIWLQYEGEPSGWTLNVGDSATNNGFGGDAGTTAHNAELQVLDDNLAVYNAADIALDVDRWTSQTLALFDGALNVVVSNQHVTWSQPYSDHDSQGLERLFAIPDETADGRKIYLGVNRVVSDTGRSGCGARRVIVSFRE